MFLRPIKLNCSGKSYSAAMTSVKTAEVKQVKTQQSTAKAD